MVNEMDIHIRILSNQRLIMGLLIRDQDLIERSEDMRLTEEILVELNQEANL